MNRRSFIKTAVGLMVPAWAAGGASIIIAPPRYSAFGTVYDSEVTDWVARVVANGGSVSAGTKDAANTFMVAIKAAGVRSLISRLNLYAGTGLDAARTPFIKDLGGTVDVLTNFVSGDYSEATGLTGDGSTKFNDTGLTGSVLSLLGSQTYGLYQRSSNNTGGLTMGYYAGSGIVYTYLSIANVANSYFSMGDNSNQLGPVSDSNGHGFYLGVRNGFDGKLYKNGSQIGTQSNMGVAVGATAVTVFVHAANNQNSVAFGHSNQALGGYQIGSAFDATQQLALYNAWQTFETSLSRQV